MAAVKGKIPPKPDKPPKPKEQARVDGVEVGDHVYAKHPKFGPTAVRVVAHGKHGFTGDCDKGERHQLLWDSYLGHKSRMLGDYQVADQGADGALLRNNRGQSRYLEGAGAHRAGEARWRRLRA